MKILDIKNLSFSYNKDTPILKDVSFSVDRGKYVCLIGQNGSGKSTIAKLLMGLLEADSGSIVVDGLVLNMDNLNKVRQKQSIVFQNPDNQFIGATVEDDIAFGLENHLIASETMEAIIKKMANEVGMSEFLQSEPGNLSGGQKQRVAIAGVLAMNPDLIILDEATSMLDPQGKKEVIALAKRIHTEENKTILSITHDMEEVAQADYVYVLNKGSIMLEGIPEEIFKSDIIIDAQMDLPFVAKVKNILKDKNIQVSNSLKMESLVEDLWQYNLKK
ncbi:MAG: energy-coupling factor transporter ATPase [Erysipelotrichaceae bacterium]